MEKKKKKQQSIATTVTHPTNQSSSAALGPDQKRPLQKCIQKPDEEPSKHKYENLRDTNLLCTRSTFQSCKQSSDHYLLPSVSTTL